MTDQVLFPQSFSVSRDQRNRLNGHRSLVVWFTGLSGSGKSTLADKLEQELVKTGKHVYVLDGDNVRNGINSDLSFTEEGRTENIRRVSEIAKLFVDAGVICLASFIAPTEKIRSQIESIIGMEDLIHVYVSTPMAICEERDVKGLYERARKGEIQNFTGVNGVFEEPTRVDLQIDTSKEDLSQSVERLVNFILPRIELK